VDILVKLNTYSTDPLFNVYWSDSGRMAELFVDTLSGPDRLNDAPQLQERVTRR
jgi:hypothetical protein